MRFSNIKLTAATFNSAISVFEKGWQWQSMLRLTATAYMHHLEQAALQQIAMLHRTSSQADVVIPVATGARRGSERWRERQRQRQRQKQQKQQQKQQRKQQQKWQRHIRVKHTMGLFTTTVLLILACIAV